MKTKSIVKLLIVFLGITTSTLTANSQEPAPVPLSKDQQAIMKAEAAIEFLQAKMATYDSIIIACNAEIALAQDSLDNLYKQRKVLDKEYEGQRKPLDKLATSDDKAEAAKAKAEIKTLDTGYKTTCRQIDDRLKANYKKSDKYALQMDKASKSMKLSETKMKASRKALKTAQKNIAAKEKEAAKGSKANKKK